MALPRVSILRVITGDLSGDVTLVCDPGTSPARVKLKDKDTGEIYSVDLCYDPTLLGPCDTGTICEILSHSYEMDDCGCP